MQEHPHDKINPIMQEHPCDKIFIIWILRHHCFLKQVTPSFRNYSQELYIIEVVITSLLPIVFQICYLHYRIYSNPVWTLI